MNRVRPDLHGSLTVAWCAKTLASALLRAVAVWVWTCALVVSVTAWAQPASQPETPLPPLAAADAERFHLLTQELRCVVCQNENLADSNAPLAQDLKREIRAQMAAGRTDADIKSFLVSRYGDFITYRPPLRAGTLLLWFGPLVFLLLAAWVWRHSRSAAPDPAQPVEKTFGDHT